jgi:muramoyltetrapeptide carboxypeptidase
MIRPRALRPGDRIAIVAPASNCSREEFDRGIGEIRRLGYEPVFSDAVFERGVFSAGSPETRATDFLRAWTDPSVAALLAVRGGYGSVQILPHLPVAVIQRTPKLFIGYSDNTTILSWLNVQCGLTALHGPMLEGRLARGPDGYHVESFLALLQGSFLTPASGGAGLELMPGGVSALRHGEASGPLFGGTLTQLVASLGTPYAFAPPAGSILFLEDVNERPYRLDRMLTQLDLAGVLERASALVFGEMRGCDEPGGQITARDTIAEATRRFDGPILYGFPSGHTDGPCWTVPLGVTVRVVAHDQGGLIVEEAPVV